MTSKCVWRLTLRPTNWDCARTTAGQAQAGRDWGQSTERWRCGHWYVRVGRGSYGGRRQLCRPGRPWGENNRKICQWYLFLKRKMESSSNVQLLCLIHRAHFLTNSQDRVSKLRENRCLQSLWGRLTRLVIRLLVPLFYSIWFIRGDSFPYFLGSVFVTCLKVTSNKRQLFSFYHINVYFTPYSVSFMPRVDIYIYRHLSVTMDEAYPLFITFMGCCKVSK